MRGGNICLRVPWEHLDALTFVRSEGCEGGEHVG